MSAPDPAAASESPPRPEPVIADAWTELHALACAHRADWDLDRVAWLGMIGACRDANLPYKEIYTAVMRLNWDLKASSADALAEVRNLGRRLTHQQPRRGVLPPALSSAARKGDWAALWAATHDEPVPPQIARVTGGQPVLTEGNNPAHHRAP